jgi:hypothetical protein
MEGLLFRVCRPLAHAQNALPRWDIFVYPSRQQAHGTSVDIENSVALRAAPVKARSKTRSHHRRNSTGRVSRSRRAGEAICERPLGQSRRFCDVNVTSAIPLIAAVKRTSLIGSFGPNADSCTAAMSRYSITSSASICIETGTSIPSALAVFMLMTIANFVDCMTGRSAGFSPLRIRPARIPAWRYDSPNEGP